MARPIDRFQAAQRGPKLSDAAGGSSERPADGRVAAPPLRDVGSSIRCEGLGVVDVSLGTSFVYDFGKVTQHSVGRYRLTSQVVVAGDSAGGNLALALLVALRNQNQQLPAGAVLISPCVDLTATGGSLERHEPYDWASPWMFERWATEYLGDADAADPLASPALADLHSLPPLLIPIGTKEMLYDQVLALADKARAAGVEVTLDPEGSVQSFCHSVPGKWHVMGVMLSAGGTLRWFRDALCDAEKAVAREAGTAPFVYQWWQSACDITKTDQQPQTT